jgi:pimeloyl-[acyl-carrier protein] methyl ester esterase
VWTATLDRLANNFTVTCIDLPGHGRSDMPENEYSLASLSAIIAPYLPARASIIGWSLGGMLAMQLALDQPQNIHRLVLIGGTPQFIRSEDWPHGVDPLLLSQLADDLQNRLHETILRFLAIQSLGSRAAREEIRHLKEQVFRYGDPNPMALSGGLAILQSINLRPRLREIHCPVLLISGEHDKLMPGSGARVMAESLPDAQLAIFKGAGHAPFLSHPELFHQTLESFL